MAKDLANILIYSSDDSEVAVAPKGSTATPGVGPSTEPFQAVGWISEEGLTEESTSESEPMRAWQGATIVKRTIPEPETNFTFQALEVNAVVHGLRTRGAEVTQDTGYATTVRDKQGSLDERLWRFRSVADDGSETVQVFTGVHNLSGEVAKTATEMTVYEFTVSPIGDVTEYTTHPGVFTGTAV